MLSRAMEIHGYDVSFRMVKTGRYYQCPEDYWILVDRDGAFWRRCNVGVVQVFYKGEEPGPDYRGMVVDVDHLCGCGGYELPIGAIFDDPYGKWKTVGYIDQIRYTRTDLGDKGDMEHDYDVPVPLFKRVGGNDFCVALPDGCIVDERGFVKP
jgi:hypothetical protein